MDGKPEALSRLVLVRGNRPRHVPAQRLSLKVYRNDQQSPGDTGLCDIAIAESVERIDIEFCANRYWTLKIAADPNQVVEDDFSAQRLTLGIKSYESGIMRITPDLPAGTCLALLDSRIELERCAETLTIEMDGGTLGILDGKVRRLL